MALLFHDSFDHYDTATALAKGWTITISGSSSFGPSAANGRNGTASLRLVYGTSTNNQSCFGDLALSPSGATCIVQGSIKPATLPSQTLILFTIYNGTTAQVSVFLTTSGALEVRRGAAGGSALLATAATSLTAGVTYYLEFKVLVDNTTGTLDMKLDGASIMSVTGLDTCNTAGETWTGLRMGMPSGVTGMSANVTVDWDDFVVMDGSGSTLNAMIGDARQIAHLPIGDGASLNWSPSTGTAHYALVDENPPTSADYVQSGTVGHVDTLTYPAMGVTGTVYAVTQPIYAQCAVAGLRQLVAVVRIGGTDYAHPTPQMLGADLRFYRFTWETNPATAAAWTVAEIDAAEFGYKVAA